MDRSAADDEPILEGMCQRTPAYKAHEIQMEWEEPVATYSSWRFLDPEKHDFSWNFASWAYVGGVPLTRWQRRVVKLKTTYGTFVSPVSTLARVLADSPCFPKNSRNGFSATWSTLSSTTSSSITGLLCVTLSSTTSSSVAGPIKCCW